MEGDEMKWEYKTQLVGKVDLELDRITKYLNLQGNDGWELVAVDNGVTYFKRPIQEVEEETISPMLATDWFLRR